MEDRWDLQKGRKSVRSTSHSVSKRKTETCVVVD